jgi:hypothetical protein
MLATKQRLALIESRGEPITSIEFDVFADKTVSMWSHFEHSANFTEMKSALIAIRDHIDRFVDDQKMCPFYKQPE